MNHYTIGTSGEGVDAYRPMLRFKCMLLHKWFRIDFDPELENQINDRWSFNKFLHLPLSKLSPEHSTFSRFRSRLSKKTIDQINSEILRQFESQGLSIKDGIAVNARLVKSASNPLSNDEFKTTRIKEAPRRENWILAVTRSSSSVICYQPELLKMMFAHYGLKEHYSVNTNHGFVLATAMTPASVHDTNYLPYCTVYSRHTNIPLKKYSG